MRREHAKHVAGLALLGLGLAGCAQIIGIEEPSEGQGSFQDSGTSPPDTRPDGGIIGPGQDGGVVLPPGSCADAPRYNTPANYGGIGTMPGAIAVGDLNQDSILDVVIADEQGSLTILFGGLAGMPGTFGGNVTVSVPVVSPCTGPSIQGVAIGDFDGDTRNDLAYLSGRSCPTRLVVRRQNAAMPGTFGGEQVITTLDVGGASMSINAGKLNADGRADLVVLTEQSLQVFLARTDMAGAFTAGFSETSSGFAPFKFVLPQIVDLNGDGFPDLLWPTQTIRYSVQSPDHTAQFPASSGLGTTNPHAFAVGRIDGDTLNDVLVAGNVNQIYLQNPSDHSFAPTGTLMAPIAESVSIVDVNGDGRADVVSGPQAILACKAPAAAGTFSTNPVSLPINGVNLTYFYDLNGDGRLDVLGINQPAAQLVVALQQ